MITLSTPGFGPLFLLSALLFWPGHLGAASGARRIVDDFSAEGATSAGAPRFLVTDSGVGGKSSASSKQTQGVLTLDGEIAPARGMPGWVSLVIPLSKEPNHPVDLSAYDGVFLKVRIRTGMLSVQVCSTEVQNFDYHVSAPLMRGGTDVQEVRVAFASLKRSWSEQTPLKLGSILSINLVAAGMAPGTFSYDIDEVGLY